MSQRNIVNTYEGDSSTFSTRSNAITATKNSIASKRVGDHSNAVVAYFHDEHVGNYHYGVSVMEHVAVVLI